MYLYTLRSMFALASLVPFTDQAAPAMSWALAGAAVVLIGIAKSGFGSGVGIVAVPLFVFAFRRADAAIGALLPLLIAADILSVYHHWGRWDRPNLRMLTPGTTVGLLGGIALLYWLMGMPPLGWPSGEASAGPSADAVGMARRHLEIAIGAICLLFVVADGAKRRIAPGLHLRPEPVGGTVTGVSAGVVTAIAHAAGPVLTIYLLGQHMDKRRFVGTAVIYFFAVNLAKVPFYLVLGLINPGRLWTGLWLLPLIPVGTWLGTRLHRLVSEGLFRVVILTVILLSGVQLIVGKHRLFEALGIT